MKPASVAQLIQVERLQRQLRLVQMQGSSLPDPQILNALQYIDSDEFIVPVANDSLVASLKRYEKHPAVVVNW